MLRIKKRGFLQENTVDFFVFSFYKLLIYGAFSGLFFVTPYVFGAVKECIIHDGVIIKTENTGNIPIDCGDPKEQYISFSKKLKFVKIGIIGMDKEGHSTIKEKVTIKNPPGTITGYTPNFANFNSRLRKKLAEYLKKGDTIRVFSYGVDSKDIRTQPDPKKNYLKNTSFKTATQNEQSNLRKCKYIKKPKIFYTFEDCKMHLNWRKFICLSSIVCIDRNNIESKFNSSACFADKEGVCPSAKECVLQETQDTGEKIKILNAYYDAASELYGLYNNTATPAAFRDKEIKDESVVNDAVQ